MSFTLIVCLFNPVSAFAGLSGQDKLYGQELSQRKLSVSYCPNISAKYACLMDSAGNLVYERASTESAKIASMTKIMTAIIGIENTYPSDVITISKEAAEIGESSAGLRQGDKMTMAVALSALMVPSGNDAAVAISEYVGQKAIDEINPLIVKEWDEEGNPSELITDSHEAFAALMNAKAQEIGCINTYFTNPHGLDDEQWASDAHSCARDMAYITKYAMSIKVFRQVVSGGDCVIPVYRNDATIGIALQSTDILLGAYQGCIGVKTGHTDMAGACFSGAAVDESGNEIYTIVMNSENESVRFVDTQVLFDWYFENLSNYMPAQSTDTKIEVSSDTTIDGQVGVVANVSHRDWTSTKIPVTTQTQNTKVPVLTFAGNVYLSLDDSDIKGDYHVGDYVCDLVLSQHNIEVGRIPLYAAQDQLSPNIFQQIGVGIDRFFRSISGDSQYATSEVLSTTDSIAKKE